MEYSDNPTNNTLQLKNIELLIKICNLINDSEEWKHASDYFSDNECWIDFTNKSNYIIQFCTDGVKSNDVEIKYYDPNVEDLEIEKDLRMAIEYFFKTGEFEMIQFVIDKKGH